MFHLNEFIQHHWQLWLALFIIILLIAINEWLTKKKQAQRRSPQGVVELMNHENAVVFDLRDAEAFKKGHIIQAIQAGTTEIQATKMKPYQTKPIILVCARGQQSTALGMKLRQQGYTQVFILEGGMSAWQNAGLPLVKK